MPSHAAEHHEWESSPWPLVLSVGVLFLAPFSFSLYFVYDKPFISVISLALGVILVLLAVAGWIKEVMAEKQARGGVEAGYGTGAMPFFIIAEALIFLGLLVSYWVTRLLQPEWPPAHTPEFELFIPILMTVILVSSSVTIHLAEARLDRDDNSGFVKWLIVTLILGTVFLLISVYEWNVLFAEGFNFKTNIFSTFFFSITGFHGTHIFFGLGLFVCILIPALGARVSKTFVKSAAMYWHFVDIVWFFVVSQLYFW